MALTPQREAFIKWLVDYLTSHEATQSMKLQFHDADAMTWSAMRTAIGLRGYHVFDADVQRARAQVLEFLGWQE